MLNPSAARSFCCGFPMRKSHSNLNAVTIFPASMSGKTAMVVELPKGHVIARKPPGLPPASFQNIESPALLANPAWYTLIGFATRLVGFVVKSYVTVPACVLTPRRLHPANAAKEIVFRIGLRIDYL